MFTDLQPVWEKVGMGQRVRQAHGGKLELSHGALNDRKLKGSHHPPTQNKDTPQPYLHIYIYGLVHSVSGCECVEVSLKE